MAKTVTTGRRKPRQPMKRHYSGNHSKKFWTRVANIKDETQHHALYSCGVLMQEMESRILQWLENAEGDR